MFKLLSDEKIGAVQGFRAVIKGNFLPQRRRGRRVSRRRNCLRLVIDAFSRIACDARDDCGVIEPIASQAMRLNGDCMIAVIDVFQ